MRRETDQALGIRAWESESGRRRDLVDVREC